MFDTHIWTLKRQRSSGLARFQQTFDIPCCFHPAHNNLVCQLLNTYKLWLTAKQVVISGLWESLTKQTIKRCEIISYWLLTAFYTFKLLSRLQGTQQKCSTFGVKHEVSRLTWQGRVDAQPKFILGDKERKKLGSCVEFKAFLFRYVARMLTGNTHSWCCFAFTSCCICNNPLHLFIQFSTNKVHFGGCDEIMRVNCTNIKCPGSFFVGFIHNFTIRP